MRFIFFTVAFLFLLELFLLVEQISPWFIGASAIALLMFFCWRFFKKPDLAILVGLHALSVLLFLYFSHSFLLSQLIVFAATGICYLMLKKYAVASLMVFAAFLFLILSYQLEFHLSVPISLLLVFSASALTFFSSLSSLLGIGKLLKPRLFYISLIAGLVFTEFYFALSKLPFNILSLDFLMIVVYYLFLDFIGLYFSRKLTMKAFARDLSFVFSSFVFVLFSARWFPH